MKYDNVGLGKFTGVNDSIYASHHPRVKIPTLKNLVEVVMDGLELGITNSELVVSEEVDKEVDKLPDE